MSGLKWPVLPKPGRTVRLPFGCPPHLVELSGYDGAGRLLAMWWTPLGDELMLADGTTTATGDYRGWLAFCAHPLSRLFLNPYELGSSEQEAEHWLARRPSARHARRRPGARCAGAARHPALRAARGHRRALPHRICRTARACVSRTTPRVNARRHPRSAEATCANGTSASRSSSGTSRRVSTRPFRPHGAPRPPRSPLAALQTPDRLAGTVFSGDLRSCNRPG
jgi:hypothetical protein